MSVMLAVVLFVMCLFVVCYKCQSHRKQGKPLCGIVMGHLVPYFCVTNFESLTTDKKTDGSFRWHSNVRAMQTPSQEVRNKHYTKTVLMDENQEHKIEYGESNNNNTLGDFEQNTLCPNIGLVEGVKMEPSFKFGSQTQQITAYSLRAASNDNPTIYNEKNEECFGDNRHESVTVVSHQPEYAVVNKVIKKSDYDQSTFFDSPDYADRSGLFDRKPVSEDFETHKGSPSPPHIYAEVLRN